MMARTARWWDGGWHGGVPRHTAAVTRGAVSFWTDGATPREAAYDGDDGVAHNGGMRERARCGFVARSRDAAARSSPPAGNATIPHACVAPHSPPRVSHPTLLRVCRTHVPCACVARHSPPRVSHASPPRVCRTQVPCARVARPSPPPSTTCVVFSIPRPPSPKRRGQNDPPVWNSRNDTQTPGGAAATSVVKRSTGLENTTPNVSPPVSSSKFD
jgi:hypothetical protein